MAGVFGLSDFRVEQLEGNIEESANYGYCGGGAATGPTIVNTIDRIDFSNETVSLPGNNLPTTRSNTGGVSDFNSGYGYFGGGFVPSYVNWVTKIDFSNETVTPSNALPQARNDMGTVFNSNYGYFGGGFAPPGVNTIDRLDFSNETTSVPTVGDNLTVGRYGMGCVHNSDYGYFGGGFTPLYSCVIDRLDFSNETVLAPGTYQLTQARRGSEGVFTSDFGYFAGGFSGTPPTLYYNTIDRLDFSSETISASENNLLTSRRFTAAVHNLNYGYFAGGFLGPTTTPFWVCTIDRIDFSNETIASPGTYSLTQARDQAGALSGGKSVNVRTRKSTDKNGKSISGKYAYYGGGYATSAPHQNIDRMEYATETMTTLPSDQQLGQRRSEFSAAGNSNYGYFIGGWSQPQASSKIDRMDFSNETLTDNLSLNPPTFGAFGVKRTTSLANNNYIYTAGGAGPAGGDNDEVTRMDLSTEVLTSSNMLTYDRAWMSSLKTPSYGYFCGGEGPPTFGGDEKSTYDRLDFSTESVNNSGFMNTKRQEFASFQSPEYGYVAGGGGWPTYQCTIERLDFSSETFSYTTNSMPEGREGLNAFCNENFGYIAGGWSPGNRSVIDRMEFSTNNFSKDIIKGWDNPN